MIKRFLGQLELAFRHILVYPVLRLLLRNRAVSLPLDMNGISSVLILRYDKIGDMVVTLPVFRILKGQNPRLHIGVVTSESNLEILEGETNVDERFVLFRSPFRLLREIMRMRRAKYDLVLNFIFNRTTSGGILSNIAAPKGVKIGQGAEKYRFYFNAMVSLPRASVHMFDILVSYVEQVFGFTVAEREKRLHTSVNPQVRANVDRFLKERFLIRRDEPDRGGTRYVVLNISAREWNKKMSSEQGLFLARSLRGMDITTIVISAPEDNRLRKEIVESIDSKGCLSFPGSGNASLQEIATLVEGATGVITPDTSIVHIASATSTPVFGLFTPLQVTQEWMPYKTAHTLVLAPDGCPVSMISFDVLEKELKRFITLNVSESRQSQQSRLHP